ncbi:MAG: hypothetical protein WC149_04785 [Arcobacteraceae bacterium]
MNFTENLYTITQSSQQEKQIRLCDESHVSFQAHFPGNPILAGFLQVDIAQELFNIQIKKIKRVKFLQLVKPSVILIYRISNHKITIEDQHNNKVSEIVYE